MPGCWGGYAARRLGPDAAEDILSETFLVAFSKRTSFDTSWDSALPWLYGIASRLIRKHRAKEAKHLRSCVESAARDERVSHDDLDAAIARLDAQTSTKRLVPLIASVSAKDRDTLLLYAWGDLSYQEVAAALGVPVGTVRSRMNSIRKRLDPDRGRRARRITTEKEGEIDGHVGTSA